jgi:hypothetical protein
LMEIVAQLLGIKVGHNFSASSLPILGKGEQFPGVICIPTPLCSHYKISLY